MSSKRIAENEGKLASAIASLDQLGDSAAAPRNIRKMLKDAVTMLNDKSLSPAVRAANAVSILDEIGQDPNMPSFARVTVWRAVSELEAIKE